MNPDYSVVIATIRIDETIRYVLSSLGKQTILPKEVVIVVDREFGSQDDRDEYEQQLISYCDTSLPLTFLNNLHHDRLLWQANASYAKNLGIQKASSDFFLCIDDDNTFDEDFVEQCFHYYESIQEREGKRELVIVPTELYRDTQAIRSQWCAAFKYRSGRSPPLTVEKRKEYQEISYCSSNCLWWPRCVFQAHLYDYLNFPFIYEDYDLTMRMVNHWVGLFVITRVTVHHMIQKRTPLAVSYINTEEKAFLKGKNRVILVRKNAKLYQRREYYALGLRVHTIALMYKILFYSHSYKQAFHLTSALLQWTRSWLKQKKNRP